MLIKEFRIVMPMTVEEYQVAQLYSVAQASKNETGGGEGIEVVNNEPFTATDGVQPTVPLLDGYTDGQFTRKIYHLASKVPTFIRLLAPAGSLEIYEEAWNAYPYCRTIVSNPDYMKENFFISIESFHTVELNLDNAHNLSKEELKSREVVVIDIANDTVERRDYKPDEDPTTYKSQKTGRGPLKGAWNPQAVALQKKGSSQNQQQTQETISPLMCCYKLVKCEFKWWGLQGRVEKFIQKSEKRIFTNFHRQVFCWTDQWYGLTMADIRRIEEETKKELDDQRAKGEVRGTTGKDD